MSFSSLLGLCSTVLVLAQAGCTPFVRKTSVPSRAHLLMAMAGAEARLIVRPVARLHRLLNLANHQINRGDRGGAATSLTGARETLEKAQGLNEHQNLAAWVSISQLSRRAWDLPSAIHAIKRAEGFVRSLEPISRRAQYVRGIATELRVLRGKKAAAVLLRDAGSWAQRISARAKRRQAFRAISWALFLCDDYPGGQAVLRGDPDPSWRTDTLLALAGGSPGAYRRFGKSLAFEETYSISSRRQSTSFR